MINFENTIKLILELGYDIKISMHEMDNISFPIVELFGRNDMSKSILSNSGEDLEKSFLFIKSCVLEIELSTGKLFKLANGKEEVKNIRDVLNKSTEERQIKINFDELFAKYGGKNFEDSNCWIYRLNEDLCLEIYVLTCTFKLNYLNKQIDLYFKSNKQIESFIEAFKIINKGFSGEIKIEEEEFSTPARIRKQVERVEADVIELKQDR